MLSIENTVSRIYFKIILVDEEYNNMNKRILLILAIVVLTLGQCEDNQYLNTTDTLCYFCRDRILNCKRCSGDAAACTDCAGHYMLNATSQCQVCNNPGCWHCDTNVYTCDECDYDYYFL